MWNCREIFTNPGSEIRDVYKPKVNYDGTVSLVVTGQENVQDFINSYAEVTDISTIIARLNNGDLTALGEDRGTFGDFTGFPKTLAEFMQLQIDCSNLFDTLPQETKEKFNFDKNQFLAQAGSIEWLDNVKDSVSLENKEKIEKMVYDFGQIKNEEVKKEMNDNES